MSATTETPPRFLARWVDTLAALAAVWAGEAASTGHGTPPPAADVEIEDQEIQLMVALIHAGHF